MAVKRNNPKPVIFLSHFSQEAGIALALKVTLEEAFLGMVEVFVSSDGKSIPKGQDFPATIRAAITNATYGIVLLSPDSVSRPWVNIEFGAFWVLNKPIMPLLHGEITFAQLEPPYNTPNGTTASDFKGMNELVGNMADALGINQPKVDWSAFHEAIQKHWNQKKSPG